MEKILVIGSGGREHALGHKLKSPHRQLFFAPGNGGTCQKGTNVEIDPNDTERLLGFAVDNHVNLAVVGPEGPLTNGVVDAFQERRINIFGPTQEAAKLEADKAWATDFMQRHNIPHPTSHIFSNQDAAIAFILSSREIPVIKYPYLAAGKGVIVPDSRDEAISAVQKVLGGRFGKTKTILIQEKLIGPEVSIMAFSDGRTVIPLLPAQDHKRVLDDDKGPNTGGMGAYAPVPIVTPELFAQIQQTILQPTIDGMREENNPYKGILYTGLMLTNQGPMVLEYNVRFGDPETQPLMMLLQSDLAPILFSCLNGTLDQQKIQSRQGFSVCVVLTSKGYPEKYDKGLRIRGTSVYDPDIQVFHAGTIYKNGQLVTNGGRVLGVTSFGDTMEIARNKAYLAIAQIDFEGKYYRKDIGKKAYVSN